MGKVLDLKEYNRYMHIPDLLRPIITRLLPIPKAFVYVALGDSTVEGIGASAPEKSYTGIIHQSLKEVKKDVQYYNLGKDGARINDVLQSQMDQAISFHPDLITISIGANDIRRITRVSAFEKSLDSLLHTLSSTTKAVIVINTIPDISITPRIPRHAKVMSRILVRRLNKQIEYFAKKYQVILVDMFQETTGHALTLPEIVGADGYHPSDYGYAMWANAVLAQINHIVFQKKQSEL